MNWLPDFVLIAILYLGFELFFDELKTRVSIFKHSTKSMYTMDYLHSKRGDLMESLLGPKSKKKKPLDLFEKTSRTLNRMKFILNLKPQLLLLMMFCIALVFKIENVWLCFLQLILMYLMPVFYMIVKVTPFLFYAGGIGISDEDFLNDMQELQTLNSNRNKQRSNHE
jgi:hypothetical protein